MSSPDDMLVPPRFQDEIHSLIPNSEIKRYPGGHVFMLLPMYHAQFMEDVLAFLVATLSVYAVLINVCYFDEHSICAFKTAACSDFSIM